MLLIPGDDKESEYQTKPRDLNTGLVGYSGPTFFIPPHRSKQTLPVIFQPEATRMPIEM